MTKRNLTLGTASGRLGSVVYFRRRGQQIARVLVSQVNDKKTIDQCYVRGRFADYVNLWRLLRPYVESSWRGVSRYGSPENAFYRHNRGLIPVCSAQMSREGYAFPNFGLVTYGSLPVSVSLSYGSYPPAPGTSSQNAAWLSNVEIASRPSTLADLWSAFLSSNMGIEQGDVLHILAYMYSFDPINFAPSAALGGQPLVIHYSTTIGDGGTALLANAMPALDWKIGVEAPSRRILGVWPASSLFPDIEEYIQRGCFITMFVERPNNPRYSRFSRSRFVMPPEERFYLYPMATSVGNVGRAYATTWQNI